MKREQRTIEGDCECCCVLLSSIHFQEAKQDMPIHDPSRSRGVSRRSDSVSSTIFVADLLDPIRGYGRFKQKKFTVTNSLALSTTPTLAKSLFTEKAEVAATSVAKTAIFMVTYSLVQKKGVEYGNSISIWRTADRPAGWSKRKIAGILV